MRHFMSRSAIGLALAASGVLEPPAAQAQAAADNEGIVVTARRVQEQAQDVPIALSVIGGVELAEAGAFNVNRLKELAPTVQFVQPPKFGRQHSRPGRAVWPDQ